MKNMKRNLLATASAVAMLTTGASALAADVTSTGAVDFAAPAGLSAVFNNGDNLKLTGAHNIDANKADVVVGALDLDGNNTTITVNENATFGNVTNAGVANVEFNAAKTLTLNGTTYALGAATIDFANNAATLDVTGDTTLDGITLQSTGGNKGTVNIKGNVTLNDVTFAAVNGAKVDSVTVAEGKKLTLTGATNTTNLANAIDLKTEDSAIEINTGTTLADVTLTHASSTVTLKDGTLTNATNVAGTVNVEGGTATQIDIKGANAVVNLSGGTVTKLDSSAADQGKVNVSGDATIGQIGDTSAVKELTFSSDATLTLGKGGDHAVDAITAAEGVKANIVLQHNLTAKTVGTDEVRINEINFGDAKTLTVTEKVFNANLVSNTAHGGGGEGQVTFKNDVTAHGSLGNDNFALAKVDVVGDKTVDLSQLDSFNVVTLSTNDAGSKVKLSAAKVKNALTLDANALGNGQFTFVDNGTVKITNVTTNKVGKVTLDGNIDMEFAKNDNQLVAFEFGENAKQASATVIALESLGAITTKTNDQGRVLFTDTSTLANNIGAKDHALSAVHLKGDAVKTLNAGGNQVFANITAEKADKLTVNALGGKNDATVLGLGTESARLEAVSFSDHAGKTFTVEGEVFAHNLTTNKGTTLFKKTVTGGKDNKGAVDSTLRLNDAADVVHFADKANLVNMNVVANAAGDGEVHFLGTSSFNTDLGSKAHQLGKVVMAAENHTTTVGGDVYANAIEAGKGTVKLADDIILTGPTSFDGTRVDLGSSGLYIRHDVTVTGNVTLVTDGKEGSAFDAVGHDVNMANEADKISVELVNATATDGTVIKNFLEFNNAGKLAEEAKKLAITNSTSKLTTWTLTKGADDNTANLTATNDVDNFVKEVDVANDASREIVRNLVKNFKDVDSNIGQLVVALDSDGGNNKLLAGSEVNRAGSSKGNNSANVAAAAMGQTATRMNAVAGVGAGDADESLGLGVWANGFMANGTQKMRKGESGFKSDLTGGTVGVDTMVSDNTMVGLAATFAESTVKYKDTFKGDKVKNSSMFVNLYTRHDMANNWFFQGVAGFGQGENKLTSKKITAVDNNGNFKSGNVTAKYDVMSINFEAMAGYKVAAAENVMLTPMAGLRYTNVNEGGYTEKDGLFNTTVTKKSYDRLTAVLGGNVAADMDMGAGAMTPSAHAFVNYHLTNKAPKVSSNFAGTGAVDIKSAKQARVGYNVGVALDGRMDMVEYGVGYDFHAAEKYKAHQGTLRLRVEL